MPRNNLKKSVIEIKNTENMSYHAAMKLGFEWFRRANGTEMVLRIDSLNA